MIVCKVTTADAQTVSRFSKNIARLINIRSAV